MIPYQSRGRLRKPSTGLLFKLSFRLQQTFQSRANFCSNNGRLRRKLSEGSGKSISRLCTIWRSCDGRHLVLLDICRLKYPAYSSMGKVPTISTGRMLFHSLSVQIKSAASSPISSLTAFHSARVYCLPLRKILMVFSPTERILSWAQQSTVTDKHGRSEEEEEAEMTAC